MCMYVYMHVHVEAEAAKLKTRWMCKWFMCEIPLKEMFYFSGSVYIPHFL